MTHTPEQWNHGKCGNNADQWDIYDEAGRTIGLSYHGEANARLIAAAPDLLAALRECLTMDGATAERSHTMALKRLRAINELASAAISKATE